jgi:outer membrane protein OmpA-like peptidoglycan-associated protein
MSTNLIALASQFLTPEMIGKAASLMGEDSTKTGALASAAVPMLLAAMGNGAAPAGLSGFAKAIAPGGAADPGMLGNLAALLGNSNDAGAMMKAGQGLLGDMFGANAGQMTNALSAFTGVKGSSVSSMLGLLVPLLGSVIGKTLTGAGKDVTPANILSLLGDNKSGIMTALPAGLKTAIAGIPGLGALLGLPAAAAPMAAAPAAAAAAGGIGRYLPWILAALAAALLAWWFLGRNTVDVATCNSQFKTALAGKTINFDTGDASIAADSKALLAELATIANRCKAYKIEVAGHTDTVGDPATNKALSQARATTVEAYLESQGVPASQITAVGYGAERPAVTTGDETAMAANRRIEITVTK